MTLLIVPLFTAGIVLGGIQNVYAPPVPVADPNGPYFGTVNTPVSFDGTGSSDPAEFGLSYDWAFGDGQTATIESPTNTYTTAGEFEVCLTVTDGNGSTHTACTDATISLAGLQVELTMTCKGDINFGQATVLFRGEMKAPLGPSFIVQCFGPDEVMNFGDFPAGTTEVQIVVVCTNPDDANVSDSEKRFREGQTNFSDRSMCKLKGGSATAVLTSNF